LKGLSLVEKMNEPAQAGLKKALESVKPRG
jgi:hypothetical protein